MLHSTHSMLKMRAGVVIQWFVKNSIKIHAQMCVRPSKLEHIAENMLHKLRLCWRARAVVAKIPRILMPLRMNSIRASRFPIVTEFNVRDGSRRRNCFFLPQDLSSVQRHVA